MTGRTLVTTALRILGVISSGEVLTAAEAEDARASLNRMMDSWSAERLSVISLTIRTFSLVSGQQTYTFGVGGDFNAARPVDISYATLINLQNPVQPLELPIEMLTDSQWADVPVKNITSSLPLCLYNDGAFPLMNLSYWPIPNIINQTKLYCWTALDSFTSLNDDNTYPPGYERALIYNLAVELAAEYGREAPVSVAAIAMQSKAIIKAVNTPIVDLKCDSALITQGEFFNYYTGTTSRTGR